MDINKTLEIINDLLLRGNLPLAEIHCRTALEVYPNHPILFYFLGLTGLTRFTGLFFSQLVSRK